MERAATCDGVALLILQACRALSTAKHVALHPNAGSKRSLRVSLIWPRPDQVIRGHFECGLVRGPALTGQVVRIFDAPPQAGANWEVTARILVMHGGARPSFAARAIEVRQISNL